MIGRTEAADLVPGGTTASFGIEKVVDLLEIAGRLPASTVVVAGGHRLDDLRLVESARDHGIVDRVLLVGPRDKIDRAVAEVGIDVDPQDIVAAEDDEQIARVTVELIKSGAADVALKGGISTPIINRHMLPLAVRSTVSLATVFDAACIARGRPMVLTDAGVTTVCNFGRMQDLVRNAVDVSQTVLGIRRPRVAILSANEKQIPSLPSTWMGLELARCSWPEAVVCGPLSFDLATDPESVAVKGLPDLPNAGEVAGRADILVCPGIDTANALYKLIAAMNKYGEASLASITVGFPVPYIILSRSDSVETRLVSIALSAIYAQRTRGRQSGPAVEEAEGRESPPTMRPGPPVEAADQKVLAAARRAANDMGRPLEDTCLVVVHLDAPLTVAAFRGAKIIYSWSVPGSDGVVAADGQGPQGQEATGQVAREIGGAFVAAGCIVDAIVLAGPAGRRVKGDLRRRVIRLAPVLVYESHL